MNKLNKTNSKNKKDKFIDFAGMLSEKKGNKILKMIKAGRSDGSRFKKYLVN